MFQIVHLERAISALTSWLFIRRFGAQFRKTLIYGAWES